MRKIIIYIDGGSRGNPGPSLAPLAPQKPSVSGAQHFVKSAGLFSDTGEHPVPPTPLCGPGLPDFNSNANFFFQYEKDYHLH